MPGCHIVGIYPPPASIEEKVVMYNAMRLMANRFLRQLPVVDRERRVKGILAIRDVIRFLDHVLTRGESLVDQMVTVSVSDVARKPVSTLPFGGFTIDDVVKVMREKGIGAVPIVDSEGRLLGLVNEEHIANIVKNNSYVGAGLKIEEVMTRNVVSARVDTTTLRDAVHLMAEGGFRHLPLVDENGKPVAILTARDIVRYVLRSEVMKMLENGLDEKVFGVRAVEAARPNPVRAEIGMSLQDALDLMAIAGIGGILVVDEDGRLAGILTDMDLVTRLPDKLGDTFYQLLEVQVPPCPGTS